MSAKDFVRSVHAGAICEYHEAMKQMGSQDPLKSAGWEILTAKDMGAVSLGEGFTEEAAWKDAEKQIKDAQRAKGGSS
jgi:hypothetical protein